MSRNRRFLSLAAMAAWAAMLATGSMALEAAPPAAPPTASSPAPPATPSAALPAPESTPAAKPFGIGATADQMSGQTAKSFELKPPDGKWLVDEEGREYFANPIEKTSPLVKGLDGKKLKMRWGIEADFLREDDRFYYYKIYRVDASSSGPRPATLSPEEKARLLAKVRTLPPSADRLELRSFGAGLPEGGQWRQGFEVVDFDGDGQLDIVHGPARKAPGSPVVFAGDGQGHWKRSPFAHFPRLAYDYGDVAVADFNGDGRPDLALAMHLRGTLVLVSDGKPGSFKSWSDGLDFELPGNGGTAAGFAARTIEAADWNGDGRPDIVTLGEGPRMAATADGPKVGQSASFGPVVYLNQGDGTWKRIDLGTRAGELFGDSLAVAELNGDGHLDFVTASGVMNRKDLLHLGEKDDRWSAKTLDELPDDLYVRAVAAADFDRDGRIDVALAYQTFVAKEWTTGIDLFVNRGADGWQRRQVQGVEGRGGVYGLSTGDLDGDGATDLVGLGGKGDILVFLGDGKGGFAREESPELTIWPGCQGYHSEQVDLDRDGRDELVASFAGESSAMNDPLKCVNGGGIQVWKAAPKPPASK